MKLSPKFIGPFEVLIMTGEVAYEVALPAKLEHIYNMFHVFVVRPYKPDYKHVIDYELIQVERDLTY